MRRVKHGPRWFAAEERAEKLAASCERAERRMIRAMHAWEKLRRQVIRAIAVTQRIDEEEHIAAAKLREGGTNGTA